MAKTKARRPPFATTVQKEMARQNLGFRTLAKRLVGPDASLAKLDNARGQVRDWANGKHLPSQRNRRRVAIALGLPEETFDDEEEDLPTFLARQAERAAQRWMRERGWHE